MTTENKIAIWLAFITCLICTIIFIPVIIIFETPYATYRFFMKLYGRTLLKMGVNLR